MDEIQGTTTENLPKQPEPEPEPEPEQEHLFKNEDEFRAWVARVNRVVDHYSKILDRK